MRQHFAPELLLKAWETKRGTNRGIWCARRNPWSGQIEVKHYGLGSTGYVVDGWTRTVNGKNDYSLEQIHFGEIDKKADQALNRYIRRDKVSEMHPKMKVHLGQFINSLNCRCPIFIDHLKDKASEAVLKFIQTHVLPGADSDDVDTFLLADKGMNLEGFSLNFIPSVTTSPALEHIFRESIMALVTFDLPYLLVSDRPVLTLKEMHHPKGLMFLPVSPTAVLVVTNSMQELETIARYNDARSFVDVLNKMSARNTREWIYGDVQAASTLLDGELFGSDRCLLDIGDQIQRRIDEALPLPG